MLAAVINIIVPIVLNIPFLLGTTLPAEPLRLEPVSLYVPPDIIVPGVNNISVRLVIMPAPVALFALLVLVVLMAIAKV